jgi:transcriptional regulator with XRE-family HTH domain
MDASLATTLRSWRERMTPKQAGVVSHGRRRTPGLRREELAALSGISADYISQLEQGRSRRPSPDVLAALALALHLNRQERDHLYRTAGLQPPLDARIPDTVPGCVHRIVTNLVDLPVAAFAADWRLLEWTPQWSAVFGDPTELPAQQRNLALVAFTQPSPRISHPEAFEQALVSDLRATAERYPHDPQLRALIQEISAKSARFRDLWRSSEHRPHTGCRKAVQHPVVGPLTLHCDILQPSGSDHRIAVFTAVSPADQEKLDLLQLGVLR